MENNQNDTFETSAVLTNFINSNKRFSYLLLALLFALTLFVAFVYVRSTFSAQAKDLSAASKLMAESLKASTETLAPIPSIVQGFSSLVDNRVESEFLKKEKEFGTLIDDRISAVNAELKNTKDGIDNSAIEINRIMTEVEEIKHEADKTLAELRSQASKISLLFPKIEKYKDVVDPEYLVRELHSFNDWDEGASIVVRFSDLVEESTKLPSKLPAKYIELVGDWCRKRNQSYLALDFYKESMKRDPDRVSAKVEYYALQAEVVPKNRKESINNLTELALTGQLKMNRIRRIFNVLMELDKFLELASLTESLINMEQYKNNKKSLATLYRNNAVALKEKAEYITDEAWSSLLKAVDINAKDENVIKIYADWLLERNEFNNAIIQAKILIRMDPNDVSYYLLLGNAFIANDDYLKANEIFKYALSIADERSDKIRLIIAMRKIPSNDLDNVLGIPE